MSPSWINTYDSVFFLGVLGALLGACGVSMKYCARTRCRRLNLCFGALEMERAVELEAVEAVENATRDAPQQTPHGASAYGTSYDNTIIPSPRSLFPGMRTLSATPLRSPGPINQV